MDQGKTSKFLREGITPILRKYNCDLIAPHHTPKTQNRDTSEWSYIDWSYSGAGWAVMSDWARGILAIEPVPKHPTLFRFIAAKRGERIDWEDNKRIRYFSHSLVEGHLEWLKPDEEELRTVEADRRRDKRGGKEQQIKWSVLQEA